MTCMTYSHNEQKRGNAIVWSSNRLQYMTNADKLQVSSQMFDRGILSTNDVMNIWNLPRVPDGDKRYIRKEYTEISQLDQVTALQEELDKVKATAAQQAVPDHNKEGEHDPEREDQAEE
jgi:hypothetical protein